jgi:predicted Fe-Mo cluster-binding NifX family protein
MDKKIAIPIDSNGNLDEHFGHCKFFSLITVINGAIISEEQLVPPPHEPGLLPKWLSQKGVSDIIAGGMGQRAIQLFNHYGVNAFVGAPKLSAQELVKGFLEESLSFSANYCDH